jgi:hypothetical protein
MPNIKPILIKNYTFVGGQVVRLDDFYAPCLLAGNYIPAQFILANSQQEAASLVTTPSLAGIVFPLRLQRLVGVWAGSVIGAGPLLLSVISDGEATDESRT